MLEIKDTKFFAEIIADAIAQAEINCTDKKEKTRWITAIAKGIAMLEKDPTFIHWQAEDKSLLIWSDSNEIYSANGVCQCRAYAEGIQTRNKPFPCKHRALARIVRLYFELQEKPVRQADENSAAAKPQAVLQSNIAPPAACHISGAGNCDRDTYNMIMLGGSSSPFYSEVMR